MNPPRTKVGLLHSPRRREAVDRVPARVARKLVEIQRYLRATSSSPRWDQIARELNAACTSGASDWDAQPVEGGPGVVFSWVHEGTWAWCLIDESTLVDENLLVVREVMEA